ncbi:hypothetical protein OBK30_07075 [Empedobacter falsenii]
MEIFKINDKVKYNKTNFIISAFLDDKNERSLTQIDHKWVLLYQPKTSTQIVASIFHIESKKENTPSLGGTDEILDKIFP